MFGAAGTLLNVSTRAQNQGKVCRCHVLYKRVFLSYVIKPPRYNIDKWDEMMMNRDKQLTGHIRGQSVRAGTNSYDATN